MLTKSFWPAAASVEDHKDHSYTLIPESEVLTLFFCELQNRVSERGLTLSFEPLETLLAVNEANRDSWRPLIPLFDVRHGISEDRSFCLVGRNASGDIVATQAARVYDWSETNFKEQAENLRLFYANPHFSKLPQEACTVRAPSASHIGGKVVFSGGGWYRRDYRKQWLSGLLPRLSRALAYKRWNSDFTISIMAEAVINGGMAERCGYTNVEYDVTLAGGPVGDVRCALVWMDSIQLIDDLRHFNSGTLPGLKLPVRALHQKLADSVQNGKWSATARAINT